MEEKDIVLLKVNIRTKEADHIDVKFKKYLPKSLAHLFDFIVFDNTKININDIKFACVNTNEVAGRIEGDRLIFNNIYAGQPFQIKVYAESSMGLVESRIFVIYIK